MDNIEIANEIARLEAMYKHYKNSLSQINVVMRMLF